MKASSISLKKISSMWVINDHFKVRVSFYIVVTEMISIFSYMYDKPS